MPEQKEAPVGEVYLREARLSFPHLAEKHKATEDADPKYSASFLIDPSTKEGKRTIRACEEAISEAKQKAFGKEVRLKPERLHFMDGDECVSASTGEVIPGYEGMMVAKASNKGAVPLYGRDKRLVEGDDINSFFYGGAYVQAFVRFYGTRKGGSPGVFASLEGVRFLAHGERFGAAPISADKFEDLPEDEDEDEDETFL